MVRYSIYVANRSRSFTNILTDSRLQYRSAAAERCNSEGTEGAMIRAQSRCRATPLAGGEPFPICRKRRKFMARPHP